MSLRATPTARALALGLRLPVVLLVMMLPFALSAQDLTTPLLTDSWQATFSNPALYGQQRGSLTIGLLGVQNDFYADNVTYNQLLLNEDDRRILDLNRLPALLSDRNEIGNDFALETLGLGLRGERLSVGIYHRVRATGEADYPRTLVELVAGGNAPFIGQTIEVAPFGYATGYHELALGLSYAVSERVHLGGRIKYLSGSADLRIGTDASLQLTTGEENYALTLDQRLTLNSAGTVTYNGLDDVAFNYDADPFGSNGLFSGNNGLAFDAGAFVDLDRVRLQAAANDLGARIRWENEVQNFTLSGTETFSGIDVLDRIFQDSLSFTDALDSLKATFEPTVTAGGYESRIGATYLIGGEFDVTERLTAGLLVVHYDRINAPETALALNARYRFGNWLSVGLNYNARRGSNANFGGQLLANIGAVQLLASTDNLLTVLNQKDNTRASVRLGMALAFGRGAPDTDTIPTE